MLVYCEMLSIFWKTLNITNNFNVIRSIIEDFYNFKLWIEHNLLLWFFRLNIYVEDYSFIWKYLIMILYIFESYEGFEY